MTYNRVAATTDPIGPEQRGWVKGKNPAYRQPDQEMGRFGRAGCHLMAFSQPPGPVIVLWMQ